MPLKNRQNKDLNYAIHGIKTNFDVLFEWPLKTGFTVSLYSYVGLMLSFPLGVLSCSVICHCYITCSHAHDL